MSTEGYNKKREFFLHGNLPYAIFSPGVEKFHAMGSHHVVIPVVILGYVMYDG